MDASWAHRAPREPPGTRARFRPPVPSGALRTAHRCLVFVVLVPFWVYLPYWVRGDWGPWFLPWLGWWLAEPIVFGAAAAAVQGRWFSLGYGQPEGRWLGWTMLVLAGYAGRGLVLLGIMMA